LFIFYSRLFFTIQPYKANANRLKKKGHVAVCRGQKVKRQVNRLDRQLSATHVCSRLPALQKHHCSLQRFLFCYIVFAILELADKTKSWPDQKKKCSCGLCLCKNCAVSHNEGVVEFSSSRQLLNAAAHTAASIKRRLRRFAFLHQHSHHTPLDGEREEKTPTDALKLYLSSTAECFIISLTLSRQRRDVFLGAQKFRATWPRALCIQIGKSIKISSLVASEQATRRTPLVRLLMVQLRG
jgi:hypothetical protein